MNKLLIGIVGSVIIVGGGVAIAVTHGNHKNSAKVTNKTTGQSQQVKTGSDAYVAVDACDVLTEAAAKQVIGEGAVKGSTHATSASSADVSVSDCVYLFKSDTTGSALAQAESTNAVGVLVRAALSKAGADSNKAQFGSSKPATDQNISGYGDAAFWNPTLGQLSILKGNNWYIVNHYIGINATKGTLDQAKQLANVINGNLK